MHRREFMLACAALAVACKSSSRTPASSAGRRIAITIDDPNHEETPHLTWQERNQALLQKLAERHVQAMLFVCGKRVDSPDGSTLLGAWSARGHLLANHSYSHRNYNDSAITTADYAADLARCEPLIRDRPGFRKRFRFPFLKEGESIEKRDAMRKVLREQGYAIGHVTIDTSDWAYNLRLMSRLKAQPSLDLSPFRSAYLKHMLDRARYYDQLAFSLLGHSVAHTILMHHSLLNALFIGDLIDALQHDGYRIIAPEEAFADPVFAQQSPTIPAGESLVWSLAHADPRLRAGLRYPSEDDTYEAAALEQL